MAAELNASSIRPVRSGWRNVILVCGKCSKKLGGGFGAKGRTSLAKALRGELALPKAGKGRAGAIGVVETKCLGPCPRRGVTMIDTARADCWMIVPAGLPMAALVGPDGALRRGPDGSTAAEIAKT